MVGEAGGIRTRKDTGCSTDGFDVQFAEAVVVIGGKSFSTPNILSINVTRSRGEVSSKASVSFYTGNFPNSGGGSDTGVSIRIQGVNVFTGYLRKYSVSPSFRWAGELIVRVSAEDIMYKLLNKKIVRRQKIEGLGPMAFITGLQKRTYPGFDNPAMKFDVDKGNSPVGMLTPGFHEPLNQMLREASYSFGPTHHVTKNADPLRNFTGGGGQGGLTLHDHSTLDTTGPHAGGGAKAVFGVK